MNRITTPIAAAALFATQACTQSTQEPVNTGDAIDPSIFEVCASYALENTGAVKGNFAGSATSMGEDDKGQFVDLNGTTLTLPIGASTVTATGPYAQQAVDNFGKCARNPELTI